MRFLILAFLGLAGCSAVPGYDAFQMAASGYVDQATADRMAYNDKKAALVGALTCDMSVGAYARMPEGNVKRGVALICGLDKP